MVVRTVVAPRRPSDSAMSPPDGRGWSRIAVRPVSGLIGRGPDALEDAVRRAGARCQWQRAPA